MPNIRTTIGQGGGMQSTLPREGVDIGAIPDFWGDIQKVKTRLKPKAAVQAQALAEPQRLTVGERMAQRPARAPRVPLFGIMSAPQGGVYGYAWEPWSPGMPVGSGQAVAARGYLPYGYEPPRLPANAYLAE